MRKGKSRFLQEEKTGRGKKAGLTDRSCTPQEDDVEERHDQSRGRDSRGRPGGKKEQTDRPHSGKNVAQSGTDHRRNRTRRDGNFFF
ncbi:hypothetical protein NDU88_001787 [Pleurodeles waltl]|uniref:Uncharacterized protein n=1 Tax=Pleurodeles waltl TaxID=8319 RepID=A0AAV7V8R8_PLEWA|nr:hypothetical protein NDU88_001787 [Pleurodeles waltl]